MKMRNACLGATFKGNVIETRCAASPTNTVIILDLRPRLSGVFWFLNAIQKPSLAAYFLKYLSALAGCVWYVALNILFRIAVQKQMAGQKSFPKSRLY
jgi:hypothetical protein